MVKLLKLLITTNTQKLKKDLTKNFKWLKILCEKKQRSITHGKKIFKKLCYGKTFIYSIYVYIHT